MSINSKTNQFQSSHLVPYHLGKDFVVKKLGGENAAELMKSSENIIHDPLGTQQAIVVSAMRSKEFNTTNELIHLGNMIQAKISSESIQTQVEKIEQFHLSLVHNKLQKLDISSITSIVIRSFKELRHAISTNITTPSQENDYTLSTKEGDIFSLLGFGEVLSSNIFSAILLAKGFPAIHVSLSEIISADEIVGKTHEETFARLARKIDLLVDRYGAQGIVPILSGYIGPFPNGIENTIGRGYSDATAAMIAVGRKKRRKEDTVVLEIQKSVPGLLSADPGELTDPTTASIISHTDYTTSKEITGFRGAKAKLLHEQALRQEVIDNNITIHLQNPFDIHTGTIIDAKGGDQEGILTIGNRDDISLVTISSANMFKKGFVHNLFYIVKEYFSVDIINTSETEITFSIERGESLSEFEEKYVEMEGKITEMFHLSNDSLTEYIQRVDDIALLFCIGQHVEKPHVEKAKGILALDSLGDIETSIDAQGRLKRGFTIGVPLADKTKALHILHDVLILQT